LIVLPGAELVAIVVPRDHPALGKALDDIGRIRSVGKYPPRSGVAIVINTRDVRIEARNQNFHWGVEGNACGFGIQG